MNRCRAACVDLSLLVAVSAVVAGATGVSAQTSAAPSVGGTAAAVDMTGGLLGAAALIASFVVIGVTVKLVDLRRERSEEAAALQARKSRKHARDFFGGRESPWTGQKLRRRRLTSRFRSNCHS